MGGQEIAREGFGPGHRRLQILRRAREPGEERLQLRRQTAGVGQSLQARPRPGAAQQFLLQPPGEATAFGRRFAHGRQGMLQQGQQSGRCCLLGDDGGGQAQEHGGRCGGQRPAGGIVDLDIPAPELPGDAARQHAVGRHQSGALARLLQGLAQAERDHPRLLLRRRAIDALDAAQRQLGPGRIDLAGEIAPGPGGRRRAQRLGDQPAAAGRRRGDALGGPFRHLRRGQAEALQQQGHGMLGMDGIGLDGLPGRLIGLAVQAGQDHPPVGQPGDDRQQGRGRGNAAGGTGGDQRCLRRMACQPLGLGRQQAVAPLGGIQRPLEGQHGRPDLRQDLQEIDRALPMLGMIAGDPGEALEAHLLRRHLVEELGQLGSQPRRLVDGQRPAAEIMPGGEDGAGQQELAAQRGDGGRQVEIETPGPTLIAAGEDQLIGIDIAQRLEARQQQRPAFAEAQERLLQRPAGAPRGQQDAISGQGERIGRGLRQQPRRQRLGEADASGDAEDMGIAPWGATSAHATSMRGFSSRARASSSPAGVET